MAKVLRSWVENLGFLIPGPLLSRDTNFMAALLSKLGIWRSHKTASMTAAQGTSKGASEDRADRTGRRAK